MFLERHVVFLTLLCVFVNVSFAAQAIRNPVKTPPEYANQPGCYDPFLKLVLPYEIAYYTKQCSRFICKSNGDIVITNCGSVYVAEDQELVKGNKSLRYPDCCDQVKPKNS